MGEENISLLIKGAKFDVSGPSRRPGCEGKWIYTSTCGGRKVKILKILLDNRCENNCLYCLHRRDSPVERTFFTPEKLAQFFWNLYLKGKVEGLFLSSATGFSPENTLEKMLKTVEIIREKFRFTGYIHLKVLPFSPSEYIEEASRLATRLSINLEAPSSKHLAKIAPDKSWDNLFSLLKRLSEISRRKPLPGGITTQFVVGPGGEKDLELLNLSYYLYRELGLKRVYYSPFHPLPNTPLSRYPATSLLREHRLYQADFLIRNYGFKPEDFFFQEGNLPLNIDPKLLWAIKNPHFFPVEINQADYFTLLRIPGIGPVSAKKILEKRKRGKITSFQELKELGIHLKRSLPFITVNGKRERRKEENFLPLLTL